MNNAGLTRDGLVLRMRDEDFTDVLEVNLVAAFRCTGRSCGACSGAAGGG